MIYLDNSATTATDKEVADVALHYMLHQYGNPSSLHHFGMDAYQALFNARYQAARLLGAATPDVYFTSGGTQSNNIAIRGTALAGRAFGNHIVTTAIEHSSVLSCCKALEQEGFSVTYVKPDPDTHRISAEAILREVTDHTILVSCMHVNNETGEILPIREIAEGVRKKNPRTRIHCDAVQSFGKLSVKIHELQVDLLSASGHKIHAPKGVGLLYIREGCPVTPLEYGGSQEKGIRPGTENVPLACAFGTACEKRLLGLSAAYEQVCKLNTYCLEHLQALFPKLSVNSPADASPYVLNFSLPGHLSGDLVDALGMRDIYVSAGSACSRGAKSHVLLACGYPDEIVDSALRISFSETNTPEEIDGFLAALQDLLSIGNQHI